MLGAYWFQNIQQRILLVQAVTNIYNTHFTDVEVEACSNHISCPKLFDKQLTILDVNLSNSDVTQAPWSCCELERILSQLLFPLTDLLGSLAVLLQPKPSSSPELWDQDSLR